MLIKPRVAALRTTVKLTTVKAPEASEEGEEPDADAEPAVDEDGNPIVPAVEYETVSVQPVQEIMDRITAAGFTIDTAPRTVMLSKVQAREFYRGVEGASADTLTINYLCSGALLAVRVSAPGGVAAINKLCGPADPREARAACADEKDDRAKSLRALFGLSKLENAVHCSATVYDARWEASVVIPSQFRMEKSLLLLGPGRDATETVTELLKDNGFVVVGEKRVKVTAEEAREFFAGDPDAEVRAELHSGGVNTFLCVEGDNAVNRLQLLVGPSDSRNVSVLLSNSVDNKLYAPASAARAAADIERWFPEPLRPQRTFAMIKPNAAGDAQAILNIIAANGFTVVAQQRATLTLELSLIHI